MPDAIDETIKLHNFEIYAVCAFTIQLQAASTAEAKALLDQRVAQLKELVAPMRSLHVLDARIENKGASKPRAPKPEPEYGMHSAADNGAG